MTTRAEEIAAPYRVEWSGENRTARVLGPDFVGQWQKEPTAVQRCADMNAAFANGYKQGQQDRWIPVTRMLPSAADAVDGDVLTLSPAQTNILPWQRLHEPMCPVTHWAPLPPNPEQR